MDKELLAAAVRIIIILPLVTALAYFLIKYGLARRSFIPGGSRRMRLIEQVPIGPKTFASLLEVGGKYILLAHSENSLCVIREMDQLPEPVSQPEAGLTDWKDLVEKLKWAAAGKKRRKTESGIGNPESRIQDPEE